MSQAQGETAAIQQQVRALLDAIIQRQKAESLKDVLEWLDAKQIDNQHNHAQIHDDKISLRLEGTCEWIYSNPAYQTWISDAAPDEGARILWICAPAGSGKTILCASMVERLKSIQDLSVAYFFASPHAQSGGEPSFIIRSWITQIARLDSNFLELLLGHVEAGQMATTSTLWSIFGVIVAQNRNYTFVLDGYDEYSRDDARANFLQTLKERTKGTVTKILVFSRDETDIKAQLDPSLAHVAGLTVLQCRISKEDIRYDISLFSKSVVNKKLPNRDESLREDLAGQLVEKCDGMFLWIKLQQDQIRSGQTAKKLQDVVKNMPIGLTKTYGTFHLIRLLNVQLTC